MNNLINSENGGFRNFNMQYFDKYVLFLDIVLLANALSLDLCGGKCDCSRNSTLMCDDLSVENMPLTTEVNTVVLKNFNISSLNKGIFKEHVNWQKVEHLYIDGNQGVFLENHAFIGLYRLRTLHIHHTSLETISKYAFDGLYKLRGMYLEDIRSVEPDSLISSLTVKVLPLLETLVLNRLGAVKDTSIDVTKTFIDALTGRRFRKIKHLEISNITVRKLDFRHAISYDICKTIETLAIRHCSIWSVMKTRLINICKKLKTVDLSETFIRAMYKLSPRFIGFNCIKLGWFMNTEEFYLDGLKVFSQKIRISNFTLTLDVCPLKIRKLSLKSSNLNWLDFSTNLNDTTVTTFEWLDVSNNVIEYISPTLLAPAVNIKHLDFSNNMLHTMQQNFPEQFKALLRPFKRLEFISLAGNHLSNIASDMFHGSNNLSHINLSNNFLTSITLNEKNFTNLKILELSKNQLKTIDTDFRTTLNNLWDTARDLYVGLGGNAYQCSCKSDDIDVITWFSNNKPWLLTSKDNLYVCALDQQQIEILNNGVQAIKDVCEWSEKKLVVYVLVACSIVILGFLLVLGTMKVRRGLRTKARKKNIDDVLGKLRKGQFPKPYLVFLSFCSEDEDVVSSEMLPNLQQALYKVIQIDRQLVFRGDAAFSPGFPINEEIVKGIHAAAVTVFIVSKSFCQKKWCQQEFREAYTQKKPIMTIMLERVETKLMDELLQNVLNKYAHARWIKDENRGSHLEPDWPRFCEALIALASQVADVQ